jgi:hypothetical protein
LATRYPVQLYHHQGRHYYWKDLLQPRKWNTDGEFIPDERAMLAVWTTFHSMNG